MGREEPWEALFLLGAAGAGICPLAGDGLDAGSS